MKKPSKIEGLQTRLNRVQSEINALEAFRQTRQSEEFKRQLYGELSYLKRQLEKLELSAKAKEQEKLERRQRANSLRAEKMARSWRYFSAIKENYGPKKGNREMSTKEIRSEFTKRRKGLQSEIDNLIWINPSP